MRKESKAARREGEIGFNQPLELQEGLFIESHEIDRRAGGLGQAIFDGVGRKARIVLLAGEAFFLSGGDNLAVADQRRGAVMVEG